MVSDIVGLVVFFSGVDSSVKRKFSKQRLKVLDFIIELFKFCSREQ